MSLAEQALLSPVVPLTNIIAIGEISVITWGGESNMDIRNLNLRRSHDIKMGNSLSKVGFSFFLSLHHQNNRLDISSLQVSSKKKKRSLGRKNIGGIFANPP